MAFLWFQLTTEKETPEKLKHIHNAEKRACSYTKTCACVRTDRTVRTTPWSFGLQHHIIGWVDTNVSHEHLQQ